MDYSEVIHLDDDAFHPIWKRRSPVESERAEEVRNKITDNSWIVPYIPHLLLECQAHINVEACVSPIAAKYLFKYVI